MKQITPFIVLVSLILVVGYIFGTHLENTSPEGILLYTPPVHGLENSASSFRVGTAIGIFLAALSFSAIGVSMFTWARLNDKGIHHWCMPLFLSSVFGFILALIFGAIA